LAVAASVASGTNIIGFCSPNLSSKCLHNSCQFTILFLQLGTAYTFIIERILLSFMLILQLSDLSFQLPHLVSLLCQLQAHSIILLVDVGASRFDEFALLFLEELFKTV